MTIRFWINTVLSGVVPGGYGYARVLRKHSKPDYQHDRDKNPVRNKHHHQEGWQTQAINGLKYRDYSSYDEYVEHQKSKFNEIISISGGFSSKVIVQYRLQFFDRFRDIHRYLSKDARILCAGAREGTEVEVLRELGFSKSYGIDLNPGPQNPLVRVGDFLKIDEPDGALDMIYTNSLDHAFNLDELFQEHSRVIRSDGYAFYDIAIQSDGVFEAIQWTSDEIIFKKMLEYFRSVEMVRIDSSRRWKSVLLKGRRSP